MKTLLMIALLASAATAAENTDFAYLTRTGEALETRHSLRFSFASSPDWQVGEPTHRTARFNDVPFEVSLSAFMQEDRAIMIHAERVADGSGASDYTHLPISDWPVAGFRGRPLDCGVLAQNDVDGEHDLHWLDERGSHPVGAIWFEQHFLSSRDFNDEIVVSLLLRAPSCDEADRPDSGLVEMRAALSVSPVADER
jgi:hypothetical protein